MKNMQEELIKIVSKHLSEPGLDYFGNPLPPAHEREYAVSVELDGKSLLKHYSGYVLNGGVHHPVNAKTPFDVASIAKQFVACCIALLACEKRLNPDDSIRVYLPEMKEYAEKITVRHCISMTSGVKNLHHLKYYMSDTTLGDDFNEMEMFFRQEQPENEPGNFNGYEECAYEILGHIVERLTGGNAQFAKKRIFEPLQMTNTHGDGIMGGGGLYATAEDLVLWHNCLMNRNLPGAPEGLFDMFFSSFTLNNGELCPYGFGFFYDEHDRDIIWQYGDNVGWQSVIRLDIKNKLSVIVLTHLDCEPVETALELENAVLCEYFCLPERTNYKTAYFNKPRHMSDTIAVNHRNHPNAVRQYPLSDNSFEKYLGLYYGYEIDTYFDVVPAVSCIQIKYAGRDDEGYTNLLDFSDKEKLKMNTHGKWGKKSFPIEFYGDAQKTDFFVLQIGMGHCYFIKV